MADETFDPIIRIKEVKRLTSLSVDTIRRGVKAGTFPAPKRLGVRAIGWPESVIKAWVHSSGEPEAKPSEKTSAPSS
ncbi:helix-turn-helix transcriptional regulator [Pseudoxanthomonas winnipegensis]|uniref:AlpA family phage regulatory protein n=1 Tax=Pseudoxanthomonas winnipegensis TaxID=2480810 RepID=A0A4Q8LAD2_9GAMM|nr:AlpA family phage regulatory protein [Pseudoxanthomonas winnipegensis]